MKPKKILVVDDEERVREMLEFRLRLFGYDVALALARQENPDLVLLDIMMPELDGFHVCSRLKEDDATKHIPVVVLTGRADAKDVARAFNCGADDYVVKPYDPVVLHQKVTQNLREAAHTSS